MYVESEEDWVPWSHHRTQWNRDGEGESRWSTELARAKKYEKCQKVFRPCKLLQEVYQGLHSSSETNEYANEKRCKVAVER